jgi:DNA (cytosine-5)-methyltransferase 1
MLFFTKAKRAQNVNDYESWIAGGVAPTLNAMDNNGEAFATVLIIDGTRVNDVRVYEDGIMPTVISRYGTGGGNVPMIFSHTQGLDVQASETNSPTLRTGGNGMAVVYPIDDARELEKHQNGTGIGAEGAPAYTLDRQQAPAVVVAPTLSASNNPSRSPQSSEITAQVDAMVRETGVVRRLTPVECERLQGFPDNWTDGQADSNRYKQMGNAVAVPVVQWIINRMVAQIGE